MKLKSSFASHAAWLSQRGSVATIYVAFVMLCALTFTGVQAQASGPHELNIQGANAFGGNAQTVVGRVQGPTPFSVMGRLRDVIRIYDRHGRIVLNGELGYFALSNDVFRERPNVQFPDGQTRVWLRIFNTPEVLHGGRMTLHSANGVLLDQDPIFLR